MWIDPNVAYHACGTVPPFSRGPGFWVMDAKMLVDPIELGQLGITCFGTPTDQLHLVSGIVCRENFFFNGKAHGFLRIPRTNPFEWGYYSGHDSKVWMKGFLPSQWYVPVSTLLPVSKVLSFSPPQRSWFPSRIPGKLSHIRRISQGQVFSHSEGSRSRLQKIKIKKNKIPETNPYPGEEHLRPNIANMHKTCYVFFSMVCARLNLLFYLIFFSPEVPERNPWNFFPRRSRRGTRETLLLVFFSSSSFVVRRVSMGILETDTWPEQDHKRESTLAQTFEWCFISVFGV